MKMLRLKHLFVFLLLGALLIGMSACAAMKGAQARTAYIQDAVQNYVYDKECEKVWPDARELLFEQDYSVKDTGEAATMTVETEWRHTDSGSSKYLVQGTAPQEGQCDVRFNKKSRSDTSTSSTNSEDHDMAWELLQRVEPEVAAEIEKEAEAEGEAAKAEAKAN